jgi:ABC-type transport system involved in cytochrome bd biosynthesis fused ATPase/permease subunit
MMMMPRLSKERTIVACTHSEAMMMMSERVCVLARGRLVKQGTFREVEQAGYLKDIFTSENK